MTNKYYEIYFFVFLLSFFLWSLSVISIAKKSEKGNRVHHMCTQRTNWLLNFLWENNTNTDNKYNII